MAEEILNVHDINVTETPLVTNGGKVVQQRRVTFWVGTHGPFTRVYDPGAGTSEQVKADIASEVAELKALHAIQG